jgi:alkylation response protein AidB-like acyl-CoA dehydrogenase
MDELDHIQDFVDAVVRREFDDAYLRRCESERTFPEQTWEAVVRSGLPEVLLERTEIRWQATALIVRTIAQRSIAIANSLVAIGTAHEMLRVLGWSEPVGINRFAFAFTEPDGGQDVLGALRTSIRSAGEGYVLNGRKVFSTGAAEADFILVLARQAMVGQAKRQAVAIVVLRRADEGASAQRMRLISFNSLPSYELTFDEVPVQASDVLAPDRAWHKIAAGMAFERLSTAAMAVGLAEGAHSAAVAYARQRQAFGQPIGQFQAVQHALSDSYVDLRQAVLTCEHAARVADAGEDIDLDATVAKLSATEACVRIVERSMRVLGGYGVSEEYEVQRYFRDIRPLLIGPVTNEMARNIVGVHLGLPRSY